MNNPLHSRWIFELLQVFCPEHLYEEISGDLIQRFEKDVKSFGATRANRRLIWNAVRFFRPGIILRNRFSREFHFNSMIFNYFKMAIRHLLRKKIYSMIEVGGLAVGMAAFFLILTYVSYELSFDSFHKNKDNLYRITYEQRKNDDVMNSSAEAYFGVGPFLQENFPEVEEIVRFYRWPANTGAVLMGNGKIFNERNYFFAEDSFFKVFPSLLKLGDINMCLKPRSLVLSERLAVKMFGTTDVIGKTVVRLDLKKGEFIVTGIMYDPPSNSHFHADVVIPYDPDWKVESKDYWKARNWTYVTLRSGTDANEFESRLNNALLSSQKGNPDYTGTYMLLQPIKDIHLHSNLKYEIGQNGNAEFVYGVAIVGLVILLISWINYVNLEISQFLKKTREVGIRRVVGSSRAQIMFQFLVQFACVFFLSITLAAAFCYLMRPNYTGLTGVSAGWLTVEPTWEWYLASAFFLAGSAIAGVYPASFVIRFNPVHALKGRLGTLHGTFLKRALVTFQFSASTILLAFILVVYRQLDFMRSIQRNVEVENVLTIYNSTSYTVFEDSLRKEKTLAFRNKILSHTEFEDVTASSVVPGDPIGFTYHNLTKRSLTDPDDGVPYKVLFIDYSYIPVFGLRLKAGRNYSEKRGEDKNHDTIILNESAIHALGFKNAEEALGQDVYFMVTFDWKKYNIAGIVEDYRHESAKMPMLPTIFYLHDYVGQMTYYSTRMSRSADPSVAVKVAETAWAEVWPGKAFDYFFADQHYDQQYKSEVYFGRISFAFAAVAIFLACLGVIGISLFEANARLREVGIRKVLGASVTNIVSLLSRNNMRIVIFSSLISAPIIWLITCQWLASYPVKIEISSYYFIAPLLVILVLVLMSSGFQILRAASSNPVNHLKNE